KLTGKSVESKIRMHKKKEGRGKYFLSLFFLDDFSNLMGTFGTNVNNCSVIFKAPGIPGAFFLTYSFLINFP
ncbi:MAG: hypothetical protein K9N06_07890, partial [Candidatus Cloacimonetes bacterium]|nr:hypothetical protein [Candidatus Cloacimonadota bacterium]